MATLISISKDSLFVSIGAASTHYIICPPEDMNVYERVQLLSRNLPNAQDPIWFRDDVIVDAINNQFNTLMLGVILSRTPHKQVTYIARNE